MVVVLDFREGREFVQILGKPGGTFPQRHEAVLDHRGLGIQARFRMEFVPVPKRDDTAPARDTQTSKGVPQLTYESNYPSTGRIIA